MYHTDPFSIYICQIVRRQAMRFIFLGPYIVPSPKHQRATPTGNEEDVIEFFVKDQSALDSPELDSPLSSSSEVEAEQEESELDDDSPLGAGTSQRIPSVSGSDSVRTQDHRVLGGNMKQHLPPASLHPYPFACHAKETSYLVQCGESQAIMSGMTKNPALGASKAREEKIGPNEKSSEA